VGAAVSLICSSTEPPVPEKKCFMCTERNVEDQSSLFCEICRKTVDKGIAALNMDDKGNKKKNPII
jgi:hypothetical protein